jgi:flavin reductase (DIM6/NTAB) family NADH-FMN oxidoreductase RutF
MTPSSISSGSLKGVTYMEKIRIDPDSYMYPMPVVLVGAKVKGKPNFLTVAYCGIVSYNPPMIEVALRKNRYTCEGIRENASFSVNTPSEELVAATDYCGIYSGSRTDKSGVFEVFYGELGNAPMIKECPLCLECRLDRIIELEGTHDVFLGEIINAYTEDKYLTEGKLDITKIKPILFSMPDNRYWKVGSPLAQAFSVGRDYQA